MKPIYKLSMLLFTAGFLPSCANYRLNIDKDLQNWQTQTLPGKKLDYKVYLIGSAGISQSDTLPVTYQLLQQELESAPENSAVVFLGNNAASFVARKKKNKAREEMEQSLKKRLDVIKHFKGKVFYLPGCDDWEIDGKDGIEDQEKFIEEYLGRDVFFPGKGCSGPASEELTSKLGIVLFDSEWFLQDWDKEPEFNKGCETLTRRMFGEELAGASGDFKRKNLLMVAHHPLTSQGWSGGHFSLKEHIFPLTLSENPKNLPLPVLGTAAVFLEGAVANRKEIAHPVYQEYIKTVRKAIKEHGNVVFAAGHEDNLQLSLFDEFVHIVSGGGAGSDPVGMGEKTAMTYGRPGFSVIHYYDDGEAWAEFFTANTHTGNTKNNKNNSHLPGKQLSDVTAGKGAEKSIFTGVSRKRKRKSAVSAQVIYRQKIKNPLPVEEELTPLEFSQFKQGLDSIKVSIYDKGDIWNLNNLVWGKLWTDVYFMDIKMPVLDLQKYNGGLAAFKLGGGFQTKSIRLETEKKPRRLYQIRDLQKSAENLFYPLNKTFARHILEHQFTAGNPFSPFILNPMQDAIGIYHTNAKLFYVPKQPGLKAFNSYGDKVFLFEERPDEDWSNLASFGNSADIVSTYKAIEERLENDKGVIDQPMVLRCRLFDMVIGDWDRHSDQWRWATSPVKGTDRTLYRPIPRDRDQAFAKYEGLAFHASRMMVAYFRATHPFDNEINKREARWVNFQARDFDAFFLNENDWPEWEKQVRHIQNTLTDKIIENSVKWLPDTIYQKMGSFIITGVKARRDNLMQTARNYYEFLSKTVSIPATKKDNYILVDRSNDGHTNVAIFEYKDEKTKKEKIYQRSFDNNITKEIRIFGLEGDDEFEVRGNVKKSPLVRLIGGIDEDKLIDESKVQGFNRKTKFYDARADKNKLKGNGETEDQRNHISEENTFIYKHVHYDHTLYYPIAGYNPDDGIFFGTGIHIYRYGYRNQKIHKLSGQFQTATKGLAINYEGELTNVIARKGLLMNATVENPQYVTNFFGLGNDTKKLNGDIDFYRVRRHRYYFSPAIKTVTKGGLTYTFGPIIEAIKIDRMDNHFLADDDPGVRPEVFDYQYFGGIKSKLNYTNIERPLNPQRGIAFTAETAWQSNIVHSERNFLHLATSLSVYLPLDRNTNLLYAFKIGGAHNFGTFDFFQANTIGGDQNLRGFSSERFAGRSSFYHNNEIRWNLLHRDLTHLPFSIGIAPSFDYGRVWTDNDQSTVWHYGYGGGIYIAPLDFAALSLNYTRSVEGNRFSFSIGFGF